MCYSFFSIIKFLLPCLLICKPLRDMLYLITPSPGCFSVQSGTLVATKISAPRLFQIRFTSPNHARIQNIIETERFRHHPQNIGVGQAFLSFIPSTWNSNLKILATTGLQQIHETVNSSIELLLS